MNERPPKSPDLFAARGLHKHYRLGGQDLHVLRGVELEVRRGEWVSILGASGSGKSTLLHLLGALDRPDEGEVRFNGQDIFALRGANLDRYRSRHVGFVFQFYHLMPELTSLENVIIGAMVAQGPRAWLGSSTRMKARAGELMERLGLGARLKHRPAKLSGGERQRVAIARALINEPEVLLADEPTGNLDAETGKQIIEILGGLHRQGQTIVMVTHDPNIAAVTDRCITLDMGKLRVGAT